ncbi:hypothetical protein JOY44_22435 [Phormidium sp. CLA17]|uniref:hypothetical protein n=1 Tax=Leptolyngbya sp. Cla-17 TaxID=2803751 RepID=UPI00193348D0|nr:hypothetical protein [Leptolyngbya sp. Cla-17]MBM0744335.1 hypothetical protein [Leptolyngbya sp. Cla-17]
MPKNTMIRGVAAAIALLTISLFASLPAQAESATFTLVNKTSRTLEEFYASPPSTDDWEEDILGVDVLEPGASVKINMDDGREDCLYDFKGVLGAGNGVGSGALIQSNVSVCDGGTYEYTE